MGNEPPVKIIKRADVPDNRRSEIETLQRRYQSAYGQQQGVIGEIFAHVIHLTEEMNRLKAKLDALHNEE